MFEFARHVFKETTDGLASIGIQPAFPNEHNGRPLRLDQRAVGGDSTLLQDLRAFRIGHVWLFMVGRHDMHWNLMFPAAVPIDKESVQYAGPFAPLRRVTKELVEDLLHDVS